MQFYGWSRTGPRGENHDSIVFPFQAGGSYWSAIADGVGASPFAGFASRAAIDIVKNITGNEIISDIFSTVQNRLTTLAAELQEDKLLNTTLSVLKLSGRDAVVGHVGDTRITHIRGLGVMVRTKDQTEVQALLDSGALTKYQAVRYPRRNVLLSSMSAKPRYDLFEGAFQVRTGDRIILSSDGFHKNILRRSLSKISIENENFENFCKAIEENYSSTIADDDASVIMLEI